MGEKALVAVKLSASSLLRGIAALTLAFMPLFFAMPTSATTMTLEQAQDALVLAQEEVVNATAALELAAELVTNSTVVRNNAQASYSEALASWSASRVTHPGTTSMASQNFVLNGTFDDASNWTNIGMGSNETILNSSIARVYNGVLVGSYVYNFIYQPGTFATPTRQVTFSYDMSNNNTNDGARPQADGYRVEFRTYNAAGQVLNYYNTGNRSDSFPWTHFETTYNLASDAVRWDVGFRMVDNGYWNGNFSGSIDNVSVVTLVTTTSPETYTYGADETAVKDSASQALQSAQASLSSAVGSKTAAEIRLATATQEVQTLTQLIYDLTPRLAPPSNLIVEVTESGVVLSWTEPTPNLSGVTPERYGVFWSTTNFTQNGWAIASITTSITVPFSTLYSTAPQGSTFQFAIRADNDTLRVYSDRSVYSSVLTFAPSQSEPVATTSPAPQPETQPEPQQPVPSPEPVTSPEPQPEPSPEPDPVEPSESPSVEPEPEIIPAPKQNPEPPQTEEPTEPAPTIKPTPLPEIEPEPTNSEPVTPEPDPEPAPEEPVETPEITAEAPVEELLEAVADIKPSELTSAQINILSEAAVEVFNTAEQGSPEYEQALEILAVIAEADDQELSAELAAIPLIGDVSGAVLDVFNDIGNVGADMAPEQREKAEETVIAAVIVGQVAQVASAAAASASVAASNRKIK